MLAYKAKIMSHLFRLIVDGQPIDIKENDSVLSAMLRSALHPTGGGCLCLAGDCSHCLATVDGVSYVRTCQVKAHPGVVVERHHAHGYPPLPTDDRPGAEVSVQHLHCDVVVIGMGDAGQKAARDAASAGEQVISLDAKHAQEVIGIYPGPLVVARTDQGMLQIYPKEIVVATGAAEIQPVAPGNHLSGLVTARAASQLVKAGIDLGRVVAIGMASEGVEAIQIQGEVIRFEGREKVEAVVIRTEKGEERLECDTVSLGLGFYPRDALLRMGQGLPVRGVGQVTTQSDIPPCPKSGIVCACSGVSVDDLQAVWDRGFQELELVKRSTLAGTGTCQGMACLPHIRSFLADRGGTLQAPFTARPVTRQLTFGEVSAGTHHHPTPTTSLDDEHRRLGAYMTRVGGWWRPWDYGNKLEEYWAVREAVSIGDVSTLGKMQISGPDALEFLERLYPTRVATIKPGRSRYVLLLDERGYVLDDGLVCKDSATRYTLTFTSGGATTAEFWVRDWADSWGLDVRILNQTLSLSVINVTGPRATELLKRLGFKKLLEYMEHTTATIAGVKCKVFRLSFTGEISYELHHPAEDSAHLWRKLLELGKDLGIKPHGIDTLLRLRLEKGHIIVGQDTDFDSTPRRLNHQWAVNMKKDYFVGKQAILRTDKIPLDRQLAGFEMEGGAPIDGSAPIEGSVLWHQGMFAGSVTSSSYSHVLGKTVMLGWLELFEGELPTEVKIDDRIARRVAAPFYDREGHRARA
jgi:glycine cleavage system aminomethyltransferase T